MFCQSRNAILILLKPIYFTSIEKQVLTTYTNLFRYCFVGTTLVLAPNMLADKIRKLTPDPGNRTPDLLIARPMPYFTTTTKNNAMCFANNAMSFIKSCIFCFLVYVLAINIVIIMFHAINVLYCMLLFKIRKLSEDNLSSPDDLDL